MAKQPKSTPAPTPRATAYPPEEVAEHFKTIRASVDYVEAAYNELAGAPAPAQEFQLWDSTAPGYLVAQGLPRCKCPPESAFFPTDARGAPDLDWIAANAVPKYKNDDPLAIDIECYGKQEAGDTYKYTPEEIEWLRSVVQCFQDGNPGQRVGIYMTPIERYGGCSPSGYQPGHPEYEKRWADWTGRNAIMLPLADQAWALFPSLYGLYSDIPQWVRFAQQNVEQCRILSTKPVLAFLWPEWHTNAEATGPIGYDDWMVMLETCYPICDGVCIWNFSYSTFDANAPYWKATEDFMKAHHLNGR